MDNEHKELQRMKEKLEKYQRLQKQWTQEKETFTKNIILMQEQIQKQKFINAKLLKKTTHKRTCSDEQTFIFNQTNISSYYPIVLLSKSSNWIPRANLRSHLDSVRVLYWLDQLLLSAGQDCLVKIWEKDKLKITVREHLAPIFSICGDNKSIFTAGAQGVVRQWSVQSFLENGRPICESQFHEDTIWEMIWQKQNRILVTSSSDGNIKIINSKNNQVKQVGKISLEPETPTSISFISNEKVVSGFAEREKLSVFELEKVKRLVDLNYQGKSQISQSNKILFMAKQKMVVSAHQDKLIRFFDPSSGKCIQSIVAHSDAVTNMCQRLSQPDELISCSHDGSLRFWDLRKFKCINDLGIHMRKFDESLLCLSHNNLEQILAVGGADGQIKLLTPQN